VVSAPFSNPTPAAQPADDPCSQAIILTLWSHSGISAQMSAQNTDGEDRPTQDVPMDEGRFTTECQRLENDDASGDSSPQIMRLNQAPLSCTLWEVARAYLIFRRKCCRGFRVQLARCSCATTHSKNDKVYDWVLKYQGGSRPAVFLLGSKGDPDLRQ
jgi:hypothetical protein